MTKLTKNQKLALEKLDKEQALYVDRSIVAGKGNDQDQI